MRVVLAIPNYNGLEGLKQLLPRVAEENFDAVYVLDDASTDESVAYIKSNHPEVKLIAGERNLGAGGNRNRIMEYEKEGIIFFLDADMELISTNVASTIQNIFSDPEIDMVGNLILDKDSREQMRWNYGVYMHPLGDLRMGFYLAIANLFQWSRRVLAWVDRHGRPYSTGWRLLGQEPETREVDWVAEGSFCVRAEVFYRLGGFDPKMRFHEAQDLSRKIHQSGKKVFFMPEITSRHLGIDVRGFKRIFSMWRWQVYFYRRYCLPWKKEEFPQIKRS